MTQPPVVLFDGVCNLCNSTVDFVIRFDRRKLVKFASLQDPFGQKILHESQRDDESFDSIVFWDNGTIYTYSSAVLQIAKYMGGVWPLLQIFRLVPPFIRDAVYRFVARNRYYWFGKRDTCRIPSAEEKSRFM